MADQPDGGGREGAPDPAVAPDFVVVDDTEEVGALPTSGAVGTTADEEPEAPSLSAARVRQLSAVRRGTYRARSYCIVAIGLCVVGAGQLAVMAVRHVRALGWEWRPAGYLCGILAAMMAATYFARRAAELTRELRARPSDATAGGDAQPPPDFSTLSDGSHAWKNLEQMKGGG
jgi:hypothetical protein